jgi:hypothetical protein
VALTEVCLKAISAVGQLSHFGLVGIFALKSLIDRPERINEDVSSSAGTPAGVNAQR